jgi:hypothetical protein
MTSFFGRLRVILFTPLGRRVFLPDRLLRPAPWLWSVALVALVSALLPSTLSLSALSLSALLLVLSFQIALAVRRRGAHRLRPLFSWALLLLSLLPLALLLTYIGILTEPYFFSSKRLNRTARGQNHLAYRPPRGIRTDPVLIGCLLGLFLWGISYRSIRTTPVSSLDRYSPNNWDIGHWENVEVLGDEHSDAAAEFYLDRASSAIRITFTTPVLDYYLERLIQFDEGVYWWFPERPPPFYGEKPFRPHSWGGVLRYVPRDLYFVDPLGSAPQYHPRGGYHPLWIQRQAALLLAKEPSPPFRGGFRRPLWLHRPDLPVLSRTSNLQRQQKTLALLESSEFYRESVEKILGRFRSRETAMNPMQRYLYHPDSKGDRDHRHMRIRQHLDEQDELDRLADAARDADDENKEYLHGRIWDEWDDELEEFFDDLAEDINAVPLLERRPAPYSAFECRPFVPYGPTPPQSDGT